MKNKQLPASLEAERGLLGTILVFPEAIVKAFQLNLQPQDFFDMHHQIIFKHMLDLQKNQRGCDPVSLSSSLANFNELEMIGGIDYLYELTLTSVSLANVEHYCSIIQEKAQYRNLIRTLDTALFETFNDKKDLLELLNDVEKQVLQVTRTHHTTDFKTSSEVVENVITQIEKLKENKGISGIKVNYPELDKITNGFQRGDLIILAARPSMGKTAFALNLGLKASKYDNNVVAMFSLEMPADALMKRLLAAEGKVDGQILREGRSESPQELNKLYEAAERMKKYNIFIDETASITMNEIFAKCRKLKSEKSRLDMIIIDYLQLITSKGNKSESRVQEVSQISRELKMLAREMECPVIALSQLSRTVESRSDKRPMLSDLRESGSIEQDADLVIFLYRDEYYKKEEGKDHNTPDETEINIAKHRNGRTDTIKLAFDKRYSYFGSYQS